MQIQRWFALIGATLIISLNVYAQAPLYVLKINHNEGQQYEYLGSDSGVYNSSVGISGSGIATTNSSQLRYYILQTSRRKPKSTKYPFSPDVSKRVN